MENHRVSKEQRQIGKEGLQAQTQTARKTRGHIDTFLSVVFLIVFSPPLNAPKTIRTRSFAVGG